MIYTPVLPSVIVLRIVVKHIGYEPMFVAGVAHPLDYRTPMMPYLIVFWIVFDHLTTVTQFVGQIRTECLQQFTTVLPKRESWNATGMPVPDQIV
jgi:hypothetical protein